MTGENSEKKTHLHLPPIFNPPFPLTETLVRQVLTWAFPSHCNPFLLNFKTNTFGKCWVCTFPLKTHKVQIGIHRKWKTSPGFQDYRVTAISINPIWGGGDFGHFQSVFSPKIDCYFQGGGHFSRIKGLPSIWNSNSLSVASWFDHSWKPASFPELRAGPQFCLGNICGMRFLQKY